jgi:hypothetical protein
MSERELPPASFAQLIKRVDVRELPPKHRRWNGNDRSNREHHAAIDFEKTVFLSLNWKADTNAPTQFVGAFEINLEGLLKEGFVRIEETTGKVRLRFYHDADGIIYIQTKSGRPRLPVGRPQDH